MAGRIALGTLVFDVGSTAAPATGATITATSGATGVVHVVTVSTGAWGDNNVTGTITLGSCTGLFNDNENVTWTGGSCTVNHPDGSVGADGFIKNGAFVHDNDPPNDWIASNSTLTTEADGQVGNCLMITNVGGVAIGYAYQVITTEIGKTYRFSSFYKNGTGGSGYTYLGTTIAGGEIYAVNPSDAGWTQYTHTFEATTTTVYITFFVGTITASHTAYFDEISLYLIGSGGGGNHYMFMDMKL